MSTENIVSLQKLLKLTGTVQTDVISILSELAGYSKRRDLLETRLRKSGHSASGITQSIDRLLSVGLLVGKKTSAGARVALTKEIWNADPKIVEAIFKVTQVLGRDRRADTRSSTIIREVRGKLSKRLGSRGSSKLVTGVANAALLNLSDWQSSSGKIVRASGPTKSPTLFDEKAKPNPTNMSAGKNARPISHKVHTLPDDLEFLSFDSEVVAQALKEELSELGMLVGANNGQCIISASLPMGRKQEVFISMRRDPMKRKVFWLYTLCGELNEGGDCLEQALLENNNDCGPMRVTAFQIDAKSYLGCCASVSAASGWERELPQIACLLSNLGDQLEEKYWKRDSY